MERAILQDELGIAACEVSYIERILQQDHLSAIDFKAHMVEGFLAELQVGDGIDSKRNSDDAVSVNFHVLIWIRQSRRPSCRVGPVS